MREAGELAAQDMPRPAVPMPPNTQRAANMNAMNIANRQASRPRPGRQTVQSAMQQPSQRQAQLDALKVAMKQSSKMKTPQELAAANQQPSQGGTSQLDALNAILGQSSQKPAAQPAAPQAPKAPTARQAAAKTVPVQAAKPMAGIRDDETEEDVQESYPKPRDVSFVFPDQSISMAAPRRKGNAKFILAAVVLLAVSIVGIAAFFLGLREKPGPSAEGAAVQQQAEQPKSDEPKTKSITFPDDRPFGTLYDHNTPHTSDVDWPPFATAQGLVEYPETASFHLVVKKDHMADLSPLGGLPPDALNSLWLPGFEMTEQNLASLHKLQNLGILYIDQEMSDEDIKKIRAGFAGNITLNTRPPDTVVRDINPPSDREFVFPDSNFGYIDLRPWHQAEEPWQRLTVARGKVKIPANMEVRLEIAPGVTDLAPLESFNETDFHSLVLRGTDINDTSMEGVAALRGLLVVEMIKTMVTDEGFARMGRVVSIQELRLEQTRLTDAGLDVLRKLPHLARLHFEGAPGLTARSFPMFRELRSLRRLHLGGTGLSSAEIGQLARDLPGCAVTPAAQ